MLEDMQARIRQYLMVVIAVLAPMSCVSYSVNSATAVKDRIYLVTVKAGAGLDAATPRLLVCEPDQDDNLKCRPAEVRGLE